MMTPESMQTLTPRQQAILSFIEDAVRSTGASPSVREIAAHFRIASPKGVTDHLAALERKGYLTREPGQARNIRLTYEPDAIPIVGTVAAGTPITAVENHDGHVDMAALFGTGDLFAVRVKGDSMRDAGILEGDLVVVKKGGPVEQNAVGVAYVDGEATVKRVRKTSSGYDLIPENEAYGPLHITSDTAHFALAGPVVGVIRRMGR
jgi:repressor LexA